MSYIVFARKYRPQRFEDVIGQDHIVKVLKNAVKNNRIPHALLFSGPRGVGKTSTARILAMALNCENVEEGEPCLKCKSCRDIMEGRDVDVVEIDGASNRGIDEIRDLRDKAGYVAISAKNKVFIIDEVHMLTKEAFNALLKILEEPPEHVKFIFCTTEPFNVIPTILSRCQRFDFKRLPIVEIVKQLKIICKDQNIEYELEGLNLIAQMADGGMRDALSMLDQIALMHKKITYDDVNSIFGRLDTYFFVKLVQKVIEKDLKGIIESFEELLMKGFDIETFVSEFANYFHYLTLLKNDITTDEISSLHPEIFEKAKEQSKHFSNTTLNQITRELIELSNKLRFASNRKMVVENQLARIPFMIDGRDIDEIIKLLNEKKITEKKIIEKKIDDRIEKVETKVEEKKDEEKEDLIFEKFIEFCKRKDPVVGTALENGDIIERKKEYIKISFPESLEYVLKGDKIKNLIRGFNEKINLEILFAKNGIDDNRIIKSGLEKNENVLKIMERFNGEIVY
ncbi:MAG: DNA polymerase III subunit gamma/tau [bacterium]|uniref:DNA polymerase III subunit gamma/tau n=2 Tax=Bacteria candidate phyla TaxID=1783234 RepID=A0A101I1F6_UNCT6|nr:MAG: DNA polymerase III, subunit gamma/tau [candidate division TA06 bacterium 32_111]KUK87261.1 MAG: DNA polymerase III, subunit gamma/tau [candidate division TA06 bacterium 34_109]MDI6700481.1 DNA polymerase III subunit gamma/tau [bacterium]HAF07605.1 DNA polymerase III subunit gamma/tau [candidate division WOR-3 bacterium]HCP16156.1 DNA polymerase III subunit gamma/tau [candidate division WOR-3 bacterium]